MAEVITECDCGQLPALEPVQRACEACGAEPGEHCRPMCIGQAAELDASEADAHEFSAEPDTAYPHLARAHCSCGWSSGGYSKIARLFFDQHVSAAPQ